MTILMIAADLLLPEATEYETGGLRVFESL